MYRLPTENDDYAACAGDAVRKCLIDCVIMLEHQINAMTRVFKYIECMENEAKTCTTPIMQHFMGQLEAHKKHLVKGLPRGSNENTEKTLKTEL